MKNKTFIFSIIVVAVLSFQTYSCKKEEPNIIKEKVSGLVQKGPYINGTSIIMSELNSSLQQTGNVFTTQINDNRGSFELNNVALSSSYVAFTADGFYFDEVKGEISIASLNLQALSDITDISSINVNILTHLEKRRVEYLIKTEESFAEAKAIAQQEIIAIFGIEKTEMQNSETLDISVNNDENAILLAISLILQGERSVGSLTELLAGISMDIYQDGTLDDENIFTKLRGTALQLDLQRIRENLVSRYQSLGVTAEISNFEKYIADFLAFTATDPRAGMEPTTNITTTGATLNGIVNPNSSSTIVTFEYGLTTEYGSSVTADQSPVSGNINTNVSADISSLSPGTEYHFRVKAENELGTIFGEDQIFTTLGQAPTANTLAATDITISDAKLNGTVNANELNTIATFEYGLTAEYGSSTEASQSPVSGDTSVNVSANVSNLSPGTEYHFRIKTVNDLGTIYGEDLTFTTPGNEPTAITLGATNITNTTAKLNAEINPNHLNAIVIFEYGLTMEYGNSIEAEQNPISGNSVLNASAEISNLTPLGTVYFFRVKAQNDLGIVYGENMIFSTGSNGLKGTITDIDNNTYQTIGIGNQIWMQENLKVTHYSDGTEIPFVESSSDWYDLEPSDKAFCYLDNTISNADRYGVLYNWAAAMYGSSSANSNPSGVQGVCPEGWHLPSEGEWIELENYLANNGYNYDGTIGGGGEKIGKATASDSGWPSSTNTGAVGNNDYPAMRNASGFSALPSGERGSGGEFYGPDHVIFWSATEESPNSAWARILLYNNSSLFSGGGGHIEEYGYSVRCVKD